MDPSMALVGVVNGIAVALEALCLLDATPSQLMDTMDTDPFITSAAAKAKSMVLASALLCCPLELGHVVSQPLELLVDSLERPLELRRQFP